MSNVRIYTKSGGSITQGGVVNLTNLANGDSTLSAAQSNVALINAALAVGPVAITKPGKYYYPGLSSIVNPGAPGLVACFGTAAGS